MLWMVKKMIDFIILFLKEIQINTWIIIGILLIGYLFREGISNFFSKKLLEKQQLHDQQRDANQNKFQEKLLQQTAELQKNVLAAIEAQKSEIQKELSDIDYKRDYYKKIIDHRIDAYEKLSIYLDSIWTQKKSSALQPETVIYSCFENEVELRRAHELLINYCPGAHWYSDAVYDNYSNLSRYLVNTIDMLNGTIEEKTIQSQNNCNVIKYQIADTLCKLKIAIAEDRINFDKVEDFFDNQRQQIENAK